MKLAIPVDTQNLESGVCPSFGRAPYFLLLDTTTKAHLFLENEAAASQGGAGIKAAQSLVDQDVTVVLTPRCGGNAGEVLGKAEVSIYKTIPGTAQHNIEAFLAKQLSPLSEFHPGFHGHEK